MTVTEYRIILEGMYEAGYAFLSMGDVAKVILDGGLLPLKFAVVRHDIDTDPAFALEYARVDSSFGINSSYYFRLSTFKPKVIDKLTALGFEVSYHYEEISDFAKKNKITVATELYTHFPEIQEMFMENLEALRAMTCLPMHTVAAHGDFVNRILGVYNYELLAQERLRDKCRIWGEAYNPWLIGKFHHKFCDAPFPLLWKDRRTPNSILSNNENVQILVHPRHWRVNWIENSKENVRIAVEGLLFR